jgi:hypothetical protein
MEHPLTRAYRKAASSLTLIPEELLSAPPSTTPQPDTPQELPAQSMNSVTAEAAQAICRPYNAE